jgi:hypothetical protein
MFRFLGMFGMGGGFLLISPKLRTAVQLGLDSGITYMSLNAPWSYCGAVALGLVFVGVTLYRGAQPR